MATETADPPSTLQRLESQPQAHAARQSLWQQDAICFISIWHQYMAMSTVAQGSNKLCGVHVGIIWGCLVIYTGDQLLHACQYCALDLVQ